jgi:hypothetical protein
VSNDNSTDVIVQSNVVLLGANKTLEELAEEGKYASIDHKLPPYLFRCDVNIFYGSTPVELVVREIYAPGDDTGWAVVHKKGTKETQIIRGPWRLVIKRKQP